MSATPGNRIEALAAALLRAAATGRAPDDIPGPRDCPTTEALGDHLSAAAHRATKAGRSLFTYLHTLYRVAGPLADRETLGLDTVAALHLAAATGHANDLPAGWRTAEYPPNDETTNADWQALMLSQLADLADLADAGPLDKYAEFGTRIPRPEGAVRATGDTWFNFTPAGYVDCSLSHPEALPADATALSWEDLCDVAVLGQIYE